MRDPARAGGKTSLFLWLCWLYTCIHFDRSTLGVLADSIKAEFHLDDAALGLLTGSAFSIVYALLGLYFGRIADHSQRLRLTIAGAWIWSLASVCGGLAPNAAVLLLSRAGIAAGEGVATAAAVSLMAELAGERWRARASSVFFASAFLGAGLATLVGGLLLTISHSWRLALILAGLPGIVGALALQGRHEPPRQSAQRPADVRGSMLAMLAIASVTAVVLQIALPSGLGLACALAVALCAGLSWAYRLDRAAFAATLGQPSFRCLLAGYAALLFVDYAASFWLLPFAHRKFGLTGAVIGAHLGILTIAGGVAGCLLGGSLADRRPDTAARDRIRVTSLCVALEAAAMLAAIYSRSYAGFLVAFAIFCLASGGWTGLAAAIGFDTVPAAHRGTGIAAYFLVTTLFGTGLGSFVVGRINDAQGSLTTALLYCSPAYLVTLVALRWLEGPGRRVAGLSRGKDAT
jgi:MFS family permease